MPDYKMKCIGFWKENLKSYLITYDELDPYSKYRCWVYQRADLNKVLISQAIGPFCDLKQDVTSSNYTEGAAVALELQVNIYVLVYLFNMYNMYFITIILYVGIRKGTRSVSNVF